MENRLIPFFYAPNFEEFEEAYSDFQVPSAKQENTMII